MNQKQAEEAAKLRKAEEQRRKKEEAGWISVGRARKPNPARGLPLPTRTTVKPSK